MIGLLHVERLGRMLAGSAEGSLFFASSGFESPRKLSDNSLSPVCFIAAYMLLCQPLSKATSLLAGETTCRILGFSRIAYFYACIRRGWESRQHGEIDRAMEKELL